MRLLVSTIALLAVVACETAVPDSGVGVGFEDYRDYGAERAQREAELANSGPIVPGATISDEQIVTDSVVTVLGDPSAQSVVPAVAAPPPNLNNPSISDEQDFSAVASRESIESDRQRIAAQRQAYQVIQPTALPTRSGSTGPSIVEFALSTTNQVGQGIYSRTLLTGQRRFDRNCAKYPSPDMAQAAFLKAGGPQRDRNGLDPDGDGFACYWNPEPFRQAVRR